MRAGRLLAAASVPLIGALTLLRADGPPAPAGPAVDFNRDVRPILSEHCFACHGPDEKQRKAKFRLDTKAGAFAELRDGGHALVPGKSSDSILIERIKATDATKRMPPAWQLRGSCRARRAASTAKRRRPHCWPCRPSSARL